jgi:hypothetical protein
VIERIHPLDEEIEKVSEGVKRMKEILRNSDW